MWKIPLLFIVLLSVFSVAADPNESELKNETFRRLKLSETKQQKLKTKVYSGTFDQVLTDRIADVNEIATEIAVAKEKCKQLMVLTGEAVSDPNTPAGEKKTIGDKLLEIISEQTKEKDIQQKKTNGMIVAAVDEILSDPNLPTAAEDPIEAARLEDFRMAILAFIDSAGGI